MRRDDALYDEVYSKVMDEVRKESEEGMDV
jgi:hypothetical protein